MTADPRTAMPGLDRSLPLVPRIDDGTTVTIVGLGGVGGIVARYAAVFLASLDRDLRLVLVDGDAFEPKNAARMLFLNHGNKAEVVRDDLLEYVENSHLAIFAVPEYVTEENLERLIQPRSVVVLAVDNFATRKLVNDFCTERRPDVCLISGGNDAVGDSGDGAVRRGTYGNCQVYVRRDGVAVTPSLTHLHPEIAEPDDKRPDELDCLELAATSAPQILFANLMVAATILDTLWLHLCGALHYGEICFELAEGLMRPVTGLQDGNGRPPPDSSR